MKMRWPPWHNSSQPLLLLLTIICLLSFVTQSHNLEENAYKSVYNNKSEVLQSDFNYTAITRNRRNEFNEKQTVQKANKIPKNRQQHVTHRGYYERRSDGVIVYRRFKCYPNPTTPSTSSSAPYTNVPGATWNRWRGRSTLLILKVVVPTTKINLFFRVIWLRTMSIFFFFFFDEDLVSLYAELAAAA